MADQNIDCKQADQWMQKSLDGVLLPFERQALDAHVAGCATCAAVWEEHRRLARVATAWARRPSLSDEGSDQFTAAVLSRIARPAPANPISHPWVLPIAFACCLVAAYIAVYFLAPSLAAGPSDTLALLPRPGSPQSVWMSAAQSIRGFPADASGAWYSLLSPGVSYTPALAALGAAVLCAIGLAFQSRSPRRRLLQ